MRALSVCCSGHEIDLRLIDGRGAAVAGDRVRPCAAMARACAARVPWPRGALAATGRVPNRGRRGGTLGASPPAPAPAGIAATLPPRFAAGMPVPPDPPVGTPAQCGLVVGAARLPDGARLRRTSAAAPRWQAAPQTMSSEARGRGGHRGQRQREELFIAASRCRFPARDARRDRARASAGANRGRRAGFGTRRPRRPGGVRTCADRR